MSTRRESGKSSRARRVLDRFWVGVLAPVIVLLVAFAINVAWERHTRSVTQTKVVLYNPVSYGVIASELKITDRVGGGSCFINLSIADQGVPTAYRCFSVSNDLILDPCWWHRDIGNTGKGKIQVACADDPWSRRITLLRVDEWSVWASKRPFTRKIDPTTFEYPNRTVDYNAPPWAFVLTNGDRCSFATGTAEVAVGIRANYNCTSGKAFGSPRHGKLWTVRYQRRGSAEVKDIAIETVWF